MPDSRNVVTVREAYELARKAKHKELRELLVDDVSWSPARAGAWKPCENADDVVRTLLWRAGMNRMRPSELVDVGDRVLVQLRGRHMSRLGAKGMFPKLFQIVVLRGGKISSLHDYPNRESALAAAGLRA
ncbi:MAG: hypothetical protein JOY72_00015 [Actinobacteria bacterium]|nr:hypothetical protein [Actinomycetota bacterium]